ncbi:MAG: hypothetical protein OEX00_01475 [Gammaproteobacteria bacterium]|nr:hypothetical protein [Gammaproteobacteria bacterium]MDH5692845.1 hypothetical protein [Gammaproteobacteria bacterium]
MAQKTKATVLIVFLTLGWSLTGHTAETLRADQLKRLESGEPVVIPIDLGDKPGQEFEMYGLIPATPEYVYKSIVCLEDYPKFMPNMEAIDILSRDANSLLVNYHLALPMGQSKKYRLKITHSKQGSEYRLDWVQVAWPEISESDSIKDTQGYWHLRADPRFPGKTFVHYRVYTDPGSIPFGFGWIVDVLTRLSLPGVLESTSAWTQEKKVSCR